jgi:ribosomal RNA assembly protein
LESGEYFLSAERKAANKWQEKQEKQSEKAVENKRKREAAFIPPKVSAILSPSTRSWDNP